MQTSVLCVDLDGTLLKSDSLYELIFTALKTRPVAIFLLPIWLARGRYHFKSALVQEAQQSLDLDLWPRRSEVEKLIADAKSAGKTVELISAADQSLIGDRPRARAVFEQRWDKHIALSTWENLLNEITNSATELAGEQPLGEAKA